MDIMDMDLMDQWDLDITVLDQVSEWECLQCSLAIIVIIIARENVNVEKLSQKGNMVKQKLENVQNVKNHYPKENIVINSLKK